MTNWDVIGLSCAGRVLSRVFWPEAMDNKVESVRRPKPRLIRNTPGLSSNKNADTWRISTAAWTTCRIVEDVTYDQQSSGIVDKAT
jgi:hypothetical protein